MVDTDPAFKGKRKKSALWTKNRPLPSSSKQQ